MTSMVYVYLVCCKCLCPDTDGVNAICLEVKAGDAVVAVNGKRGSRLPSKDFKIDNFF